MENPLRSSFVHVAGVCVAIAAVVGIGLYEKVFTELGSSHYAELSWDYFRDIVPWLPLMPANTLVNLGYVVVGIVWIFIIQQYQATSKLNNTDAYMFYAFSWMAILYGPVQLVRILIQTHESAVLDQWVTLPIFSWVFVWSEHIINGWNPTKIVFVIIISSFSYNFCLLFTLGFEITLAFHIIGAVFSAVEVHKAYKTPSSTRAFYQAILCCAGFVILKLMDHHLPKIHPIFSYITGHFLSKIADFLQFHYVANFFLSVTQLKKLKHKREHGQS